MIHEPSLEAYKHKRNDKCQWVSIYKIENRSLSTGIPEVGLERISEAFMLPQ